MELTLLIIFVACVVIVLYILSFKSKKNKQLFSNIATFIQTLAAVWAIWYAVSESKENSIQFEEQLNNQKRQISQQDSQFVQQYIQISNQSIKDSLMIRELKSISNYSGSLKTDVEIINNLVSGMPGKIDEVTRSFSNLTEYAKEETELLKKNSLKKANITLKDIETENINEYTKGFLKITLQNNGNIEGKVSKISFYFDRNLFTAVGWELQYDQCIITHKEREIEFSIDLTDYNFLVFAYDTKIITACNGMKFTRKYLDSKSLLVKYQIIFTDINEGRYNEGYFIINY